MKPIHYKVTLYNEQVIPRQKVASGTYKTLTGLKAGSKAWRGWEYEIQKMQGKRSLGKVYDIKEI